MITSVDPCGYVELDIPLDVIETCWHSGECDDDIAIAMLIPIIKEQLSKIDNDTLIKSLCEVYDDEDYIVNATREQNEQRALWIACGNAQEDIAFAKN